MKKIIFLIPFIAAVNSYADIITLKDGTRVEGSVEGEMNGVKLIKTRYGSLTIDDKEITKIAAAETAAAEPVKYSTDTVSFSTPTVSASTVPAEPPFEFVQGGLPPAPGAGPEYTFKTVTLSTMSSEKVYFESGVVIATETFDSKGGLLALAGFIKDGSYREYYENGNLKSEKTVINAKTSGTLKAYYPSGVLQSEAYYMQGTLSGTVRIYNENAKLLFEQNFKDGLPDGWFREFDGAGNMKSELFYTEGHAAEKPKAKEEKKAEPAAESAVTAKTQTLARGERISFYLNNKYAARLQLDKDFNVVSKDGKVPDGAVKIYDKDGKLAKDLFFLNNELTSLKIFNENGGLTGEYAYQKDKAVKK